MKPRLLETRGGYKCPTASGILVEKLSRGAMDVQVANSNASLRVYSSPRRATILAAPLHTTLDLLIPPDDMGLVKEGGADL